MSTTIRVSTETRLLALDLARRTGAQMQVVVATALDAYEKSLFWDAFDQGYERLADDADAWSSVQAERLAESPALADGNP